MDLGHWIYVGEFDIKDWFGFIYRIIEKDTGMQYIGKKQFHSYLKKPVKHRKNKKSIIKESTWKYYTSSSERLNKKIIEKGKDNYIFLIESLHKTRGSLFYAEVEQLILNNVLLEKLDNGERKYYNGHIPGVKFIPPSEHSDETRAKISKILKLKYLNKDNFWFNKMSEEEKIQWKENYLIGKNGPRFRNKSDEEINKFIEDNYVGENNPMYGRKGELSPRFNVPVNEETRSKMSIAKKGIPLTEKHKENIKNSSWSDIEKFENHKKMLSEKNSGVNNPMYGKPCYYKMSEEEKIQWKENLSKATKGKPKSDETKKRMSAAQKGLKKPTTICPHCNKEGGKNNMQRYHFDNCKSKH